MRLVRWIVLASLTATFGCGSSADNYRYSREKAQKSLVKLEEPGLIIGEFALANNGVVDGDTIRVDGLETSLRLLAIDTEEKFSKGSDRREAEADWDAYLAKKRAASKRPWKGFTPMGIEATQWAKEFFADVSTVRLERDHPKEIRGYYNRYLAYVFARKDGQWINYNVEATRAGMTPYFTKYGYSRRYHADFVAAEDEARAAKRGIWAPGAKAYGDYDVRKAWWDARAEFIKKFEIDAQGRDDMIALTNWDALKRIEENVGREIELLGGVGEVRMGEKGPTKVMLSRRMFADFPIIFFDKDVFAGSGIASFKGEFVRIRGVVNKYHNKYRKRDELQIIVNLPAQVVGDHGSDTFSEPTDDAAPSASPPTTTSTMKDPS
jgi:endonuclease YncB( thermonuclease family)